MSFTKATIQCGHKEQFQCYSDEDKWPTIEMGKSKIKVPNAFNGQAGCLTTWAEEVPIGLNVPVYCPNCSQEWKLDTNVMDLNKGWTLFRTITTDKGEQQLKSMWKDEVIIEDEWIDPNTKPGYVVLVQKEGTDNCAGFATQCTSYIHAAVQVELRNIMKLIPGQEGTCITSCKYDQVIAMRMRPFGKDYF